MPANYFGLVIATSEYGDPRLRRLRAPGTDAHTFSQVLLDEHIGGYNVQSLIDQPAHITSEAIEGFFKDRNIRDQLLLYFSCHGIKDDRGRLHFAASTTNLDRLASTGISSQFVAEQMYGCRAQRIILILDCCYSGAFTRGLRPRANEDINLENLAGSGRAMLFASNAMEYAFEIDGTQIDGAGTSSLFTRTIVHGLQTGEADLDGDGSISVEELYDHVLSQLREITPNQTPGKLIETEGSIFIANGVRGIFALGFLSKEIRSALSSPLVGVRKGVIEDLAPLLNDDNPHVRQAAHTALLQLSNDDSDRVMAAAVTVLGGDPLLSNVNIHPGAGQVEKQGASDAPSRPSAHAAAEKQTSKPEPGPQASKYALAEWVDAVQFSTTRLRPGYDELEVDAFIDAVRDTFLRIREQPLTPDAVRNVQFTTTRQRPGYDEEEVDIFLDEVELRLAGMPQASIDHLRPPDDAVTSTEATEAARAEGVSFGELVARDAPALWLEAVLARKPRMPSDLEARMLQNSSLPIDALLQDRVRDALRRGFWTGLESAR